LRFGTVLALSSPVTTPLLEERMQKVFILLVMGILVVRTPFLSLASEENSQQYAALSEVNEETKKSDEQAIYRLIEQYRLGYQLADTNALAEVFVDFSPMLQTALSRYRQNAKDLTVRIEEIRIRQVDEHQAVAAFIREDYFTDAQTGRPVQVKADLTKNLVLHNGQWKMLAMGRW
jgi:hypothetical protein